MAENYTIPTFEQLPKAVAELHDKVDAVFDYIKSRDSPQTPTRPDIMYVEQCAQYLGKTVSTIYTMCSKGTIPHHKGGNKLYFFTSELVEWLKDSTDNKTNSNTNNKQND